VSPPDDEKVPEFLAARVFLLCPPVAPPSIFFIVGGDGGDRGVTTLSWTAFSRNHRGGDTVVTDLGAVGGQSPFLGLP